MFSIKVTGNGQSLKSLGYEVGFVGGPLTISRSL